MAVWLEQASQWYEVCCHDLEVMSSNPGWVELGMYSTSVPSRTWTKHIIEYLAEHNVFTWLSIISPDVNKNDRHENHTNEHQER